MKENLKRRNEGEEGREMDLDWKSRFRNEEDP